VTRVLAAAFKHETNTFSPLPTDLAAYGARCLRRGADVPAYFKGTATEMGAFIDAADSHGWELVHSVAADATPSGKVTRAAFDQVVGAIEAALRTQGPFDAVLLCLHGAMVAEHVDDGEGEILRRLRAIAGNTLPIGVTLDLHANVTEAMAAQASVIVSYRTYPHVDQYDTGRRCADLIARAIADEIDPVCCVARGAMIDAVDHGRTSAPGPMLETLASADALRASTPGVLDIGINAGFPWADIELAGPSVVVVADRKAGAVDTQSLTAALLRQMWHDRQRATVKPLALQVQVVSVQPGRFTFTGPMSRGIALDIGTTAVLRAGGIDIVVSGTRHQVLDPGFFTHAGIDPMQYDVVVVKSSQHFRAAFGPMAREILVIDSGDGLTSFDLRAFGHRKVRRPVYPLDELPD
jgi:microcystin degradation protein MlrC